MVPDEAKNSDAYLWYPSWLASNNRPFYLDLAMIIPGDEVRLNQAKTQIVQRNTLRDDQLIASGTNLAWKDHPRLGDGTRVYSFDAVEADAMESLAHVTAVLAAALEVVFNLASLEEGDIFANLVSILGGATNVVWESVEKKSSRAMSSAADRSPRCS